MIRLFSDNKRALPDNDAFEMVWIDGPTCGWRDTQSPSEDTSIKKLVIRKWPNQISCFINLLSYLVSTFPFTIPFPYPWGAEIEGKDGGGMGVWRRGRHGGA